MNNVKTFNLSIDPELLAAIDYFATETRHSRSEIIRIALEQFLYNNYPAKPFYTHKKLKPVAESDV